MRKQWTPEQIRTRVVRAERELEQVIAASIAHDPQRKTLLGASRALAHDAVVSLITLYRDHVAGTAAVAAQIAREYARCIEGASEPPNLACMQQILGLARAARERHLPAAKPG